MTPAQIARLLGVASNTIRRWSKVYADFLTPAARPQNGTTRRFSRHDQRVLYFVAAYRDSKDRPDDQQVIARLKQMQEDNWRGLPDLPEDFKEIDDPGALEVVATEQRARELATIEFLQRENVRLETENERLQIALQEAQERENQAHQRVRDLQTEIDVVRASGTATAREMEQSLHTAQLDLERARSEVARLEGQLQQYTLGITDKPINVGLVLVLALLFALVLALIVVGVVVLVG